MIYFFYLFLIIYLSINYEKYKNIKYLDIGVFALLFIISAFRYRTGGDARAYLTIYDLQSQLLIIKGPFAIFDYLNLLSRMLYVGAFGVNIITSFLFISILYLFFKRFSSNIYLSLVIAFPILVIIYGMGSLRQGIAIVFFFAFFLTSKYLSKFATLIFAFMFHTSSVIYLIIFFLSEMYSAKKKNCLK